MTECTVQDIPYEALPEAQRALLDPQRPLPEDTRFFADAFGETGVLIPCLLLWAILLWVLWSPLSETLAGRSSPDLWIEWASVWWHMTVAGLGLIVAVTLLVIWINHVLVRLRRGRHLGPGGDRRTGLFLGPDFLLFRRAEESLHEQVGGCTLIARSAIVGLERSNPRGNRNAKGWVLRVWYHSMEGALSRLDLCPEELSDGRWLEGVRSWAGDVPSRRLTASPTSRSRGPSCSPPPGPTWGTVLPKWGWMRASCRRTSGPSWIRPGPCLKAWSGCVPLVNIEVPPTGGCGAGSSSSTTRSFCSCPTH